MKNSIILKKVSTHNLKNVDVTFPQGKMTVVTGVSGSGKSSLAIDTLYAEGQRRYIESLSPYTRQFLERMQKPQVESIQGILPSICIEAKNVINNARSTVGTHTEINDFLRILYARISDLICPQCHQKIVADSPDSVTKALLEKHLGETLLVLFTVSIRHKVKESLDFYLRELSKQGFVRLFLDEKVFKIDQLSDTEIKKIQKQKELHVVLDRIKVDEKSASRMRESFQMAFDRGHGKCRGFLSKDLKQEGEGEILPFNTSLTCSKCDLPFPEPDNNLFSFNSPTGACPECEGFGRVIVIDPELIIPDHNKTLEEGAIEPWEKPSTSWEKGQMLKYCKKAKIPTDIPFKKLSKSHQKMILEGDGKKSLFSVDDFFKYLETKTYKMHVRVFLSRYRNYTTCKSCQGARLKPETLCFKIQDQSIEDLQNLTIRELRDFLKNLQFSEHQQQLVGPAFEELLNRVTYLDEVGLDYLTLNRMSRTLSGGEMQRINLASALGTQLVDTLYVLDEPSIGLHERDNDRLLKILNHLKSLGNTVVIIEHDKEIMQKADWIIDIGPHAGEKGGEVVFKGTLQNLVKKGNTLTAKFLKGEEEDLRTKNPELLSLEKKTSKTIEIKGAKEHNLKEIDVSIPLHQFVVVTGVSGSGKSTLVHDVLYKNFMRERGRSVSDVGAVKKITGLSHIEDIHYIDQSPLGKSPRSCPATYMQVYSDIRTLLAKTRDAKLAGFEPAHFSFNVNGGRCEKCSGLGRIKEEMHFLATVYIECEECKGTGFQEEVLNVKWNGKNIYEMFDLTITEAIDFFESAPKIGKRLQILDDIGLGYLRLGQATLTLSAGEAQRLKLALEMLDKKKKNQLFIFDEPTVGLHYFDIKNLLTAFNKMLEKGHSLLIIEHNMDVIRSADHVIDLGPEGGEKGGQVVFTGTPQDIIKSKKSYTGKYLKAYL